MVVRVDRVEIASGGCRAALTIVVAMVAADRPAVAAESVPMVVTVVVKVEVWSSVHVVAVEEWPMVQVWSQFGHLRSLYFFCF